MKVRIGYMDYPVVWQDPEEPDYGDTHGTFGSKEGIELYPHQLPCDVAATMVHEVLHAIHHVYSLPKMMSEETMCTGLEAGILCFIRDNPEIVKQLQEACAGKPMKGIEDSDGA
jgi:hypothetical protein